MIRAFIKNTMGRIFALIGGIKAAKGIYIGMGCKVVNNGTFVCEENVTIRPDSNFWVAAGSTLELKRGAYIGNHSTISVVNNVTIGEDVLVAPNCYIADHNHEFEDPYTPIINQGVRVVEGSRVVIDSGTWIGKNAVVVGNLRVGRNCVIGANSVVTKDIPDYCIAGGVPAKILKRYDFEKKAWIKVL